MDKIGKFLKQLQKKKRKFLKEKIFPKIKNLNLQGLDVKALTGYKGLYRVKLNKTRIIFFKDEKNKRGVIIAADYRKNVYKKFQ